MATIISQDINEGALYLNAELDLDASHNSVATRGTGAVFARTGAGVYTVTWKGASRGIKLCEVLARTCDLSGTPATVFWAKIVAGPSQTVGGANDGDIVATINLLTNAATPAAADTTGACTITVTFCLRTVKDPQVAQL